MKQPFKIAYPDGAAAPAPYSGDLPYLFVSYAREDRHAVQSILSDLARQGVRFWYDNGIEPGESYSTVIERKVEGCTGIVVFLSAASIKEKTEDWVYTETKRGKELGRTVVPVRLDDTDLPMKWQTLVISVQMLVAMREHRQPAIASLVGHARRLRCLSDPQPSSEGPATVLGPMPGTAINRIAVGVIVVLMAVIAVLLARLPPRSSDLTDAEHVLAPSPAKSPTLPSSNEFGGQVSPPTHEAVSAQSPTYIAPEPPTEFRNALLKKLIPWTWSEGSTAVNGIRTLHWHACKGAQAISQRNRTTRIATLQQLIDDSKPTECKLCRYCYELERTDAPQRASEDSAASPSLPSSAAQHSASPVARRSEIPRDYAATIQTQIRDWVWSDGSVRFNGERTLHWLPCEAAAKITERNRVASRGTLASVALTTAVRDKFCPFCYQLEVRSSQFQTERSKGSDQPVVTGPK
jgi:hypothetical protein